MKRRFLFEVTVNEEIIEVIREASVEPDSAQNRNAVIDFLKQEIRNDISITYKSSAPIELP